MMAFVDCPHDIAALFHAWMADGFPGHLERPLIEQLRPHRGTWLVDGDFVFSLCKLSDYRDDVIRWFQRPKNLERDRVASESREAVSR